MSQALVPRGFRAALARRGQNAQLRGHWAVTHLAAEARTCQLTHCFFAPPSLVRSFPRYSTVFRRCFQDTKLELTGRCQRLEAGLLCERESSWEGRRGA